MIRPEQKRKPQNPGNRPERTQASASKYVRRATYSTRIRYTPETYAILTKFKDNHELETGTRLSDAFALEKILQAIQERVYRNEEI